MCLLSIFFFKKFLRNISKIFPDSSRYFKNLSQLSPKHFFKFFWNHFDTSPQFVQIFSKVCSKFLRNFPQKVLKFFLQHLQNFFENFSDIVFIKFFQFFRKFFLISPHFVSKFIILFKIFKKFVSGFQSWHIRI